jgi:hypothetical protein
VEGRSRYVGRKKFQQQQDIDSFLNQKEEGSENKGDLFLPFKVNADKQDNEEDEKEEDREEDREEPLNRSFNRASSRLVLPEDSSSDEEELRREPGTKKGASNPQAHSFALGFDLQSSLQAIEQWAADDEDVLSEGNSDSEEEAVEIVHRSTFSSFLQK